MLQEAQMNFKIGNNAIVKRRRECVLVNRYKEESNMYSIEVYAQMPIATVPLVGRDTRRTCLSKSLDLT